MKFDILYYVIGILYLIFDLEIIFLFPLATVLFSIGSLLAVWVVMIFLIILTIGFLYEWFHGALEIVRMNDPKGYSYHYYGMNGGAVSVRHAPGGGSPD